MTLPPALPAARGLQRLKIHAVLLHVRTPRKRTLKERKVLSEPMKLGASQSTTSPSLHSDFVVGPSPAAHRL